MDPRDEQRFEHGFWWGAAATVVSGVIAFVALKLGLWPTGRPLTVEGIETVGHDYLGRVGPLWAAYVLAGVLQLAYGALCGGLLAIVTERVTISSALGMAGLRWLTTQIVVLPLIGFGDFGWMYGWPAMVVTALPHLAYGVTLGWLMQQEDEGREPIPLHFRHGHLVWASQRGRR
jgi:hypothetical protein